MGKRVLRGLAWILGILAVLGLIVWGVLFLPMFSGWRASLTERVLSDLIGQPLEINDDARVRLGLRTSQVHVSSAVIPSENMADVDLARLTRLDFEIEMAALLQGWFNIDNLVIDGMQVTLLRHADNTTSWTKPSGSASKPDRADDLTDPQDGILSFLRSRRVDVTRIGLLLSNQATGFDFDFQLDGLHQTPAPDGVTTLTGRGSVNKQPFTIDGTYPGDGQFEVRSALGGVKLALQGDDAPEIAPGAVRMTLSLDSPEVADFLDVLDLAGVANGHGQVTARLVRQPGGLAIHDVVLALDMASGRSVRVAGGVGNLFDMTDLDLTADAAFFPDDAPPAPAQELRDLKLTGITTHLLSQDGGVEVAKLTVATNAFGGDLENIGPIRASRVYRTKDKKLRVEGLSVQAGPLDAPVVLATGTIGDLLQFSEVDLDGTLTAAASLLFDKSDPDSVASLGALHASFGISDASGQLSLDQLSASAQNTDLWTLQADMSVGNLTRLARSDLNIDARITDGARFLGTLGLKEIDTGPVGLALKMTTRGTDIDTSGSVIAGGSQIDLTLSARHPDDTHVVRGGINSKAIALDDFADVIAAVLELKKLEPSAPKPTAKAEAPAEPAEQPFILPRGEKQAAQSTLTDPARLLRELDLELAIVIEKLTGAQGATRVDSDLEIEQGNARFGPLKINYGGGYFNLNGAMDLINTPDVIRISGGTGGWDFGKILTRVGVDIAARGTLGARFDLTGRHASAKAFIDTMRGNVTISMGNGAIASSLLELAGLGVLPWLFSSELQKGYTDITCVVAPLRISGGKVTSHQIVAETRSVQLVAAGEVNWRRDTISLRAEPRPVGKPLHRSAWPFDVTGKLSAPQFKLQVGGQKAHQDRAKVQIKTDRKPCVPDVQQVEPRSSRNSK